MADLRAKALGYLRDAKVHVLHARTEPSARRPVEVVAIVEAHTGVRRVELTAGSWACSCQAVVSDGQPCAHLAAVQLVTNWPSAAAKTARAEGSAAA